MPRGPRIDYPGAVHHVGNRGTAKRPILETVADHRAFQALLAEAVRAELLEVHAFSLLTTHYHLLVGSPAGRLADAMRRIQNLYVRRFNRGRLRDGPLMRGRYFSRRVESGAYFQALVRYIDRNPVDAGLATAPHLWRHGSAWHYARDRRPPWLRTDMVEAVVCDAASAAAFQPQLYAAFAAVPCDAAKDLVEARLAAPAAERDDLDDLVRAAPIEVQRWMEHKSVLADGTSPGIVLLAARSILGAIDGRDVPDPPRSSLVGGLLRDMAGLTFDDIAQRMGCCYSTARTAAKAHAESLRSDPAYAALAADIVHTVIRRDFGPPRRLFDLPRRLPEAGIEVDLPERGFLGDVENR